MPSTPQVVVFDTAFHSTMPEKAYRYAIPTEDYKKYHIRKYGFHGTSHKYVSERLADITGKKGKFIVLHIGNGASISAVVSGICQDTSMGYTPLDGCVMGTRSGSVDPSILPVLCQKHGFTVDEAISYLNKKSGYLGLTGYSDARDIEKLAFDQTNNSAEARACRLALDIRTYQDKKILGSYVFALGGVDAIAFTAGIGENGSEYREMVLSGLESLGIKLDYNRNKTNFKRGEECLISADDSAVKVYVIPTNEELQIAKETEEALR
jgi:acetate kinase